uniref:Uncharacterized protein n=1 Tax=Oryzias sinensis TaxID=183150 RepID=A0A8C8DYK6_9TELE
LNTEIQDMKQHLEESEQIAVGELQPLDEEIESLTAEQSSLEEQKKRREGELKDLTLELGSLRSSLQSYNEALRTEKRNLQSAETTLCNMRRKRDEAETIRNVGVGLLLIPIVGLIPGKKFNMEYFSLITSKRVDIARSEIERCESQITSYSNQVSRYQGLISQAQTDIQEANRRIRETRLKLQSVSVTRSTVADFQSKTRRAVHQLGLLCGVGSVAELQTRHLILLEPVLNVMEEMIVALGLVNRDDLLHSKNMERIMWDMTNNQRRLKDKRGLCGNHSNEDYY